MRYLLLFAFLEVGCLKGMLGADFHSGGVKTRDYKLIFRPLFGHHHLFKINVNFLELPFSLDASHHEELIPPKLHVSDALSII